MKHPNRDEWIPYLFGEASAATRRQLDAHLEDCAECRAELDGWRRSLRRLDAWTLPPAPQRPAATGLRWAVAAAVMLGLGIGLGTFAAGRHVDTKSLRAEIEASVKTSLATEMHDALGRVQRQSAETLAASEQRLAKGSEAELRGLLRGVMEVIEQGRDLDREATRALFAELQQKHAGDLLALRTDLETVASFADDEVRKTRLQLTEIATSTPANE